MVTEKFCLEVTAEKRLNTRQIENLKNYIQYMVRSNMAGAKAKVRLYAASLGADRCKMYLWTNDTEKGEL